MPVLHNRISNDELKAKMLGGKRAAYDNFFL